MMMEASASGVAEPVTRCRTSAASASSAPSTSIVSSKYTVTIVGSGLSRSSSRIVTSRRAAWTRSCRTATVRLIPSRTRATTRTATPTQNASSSGGFRRARTPSKIDTVPPTRNIPIAASSAQK